MTPDIQQENSVLFLFDTLLTVKQALVIIAHSYGKNDFCHGWHYRFHAVVIKHSPNLHFAITERQEKQAMTEASMAKLSLGRKAENTPKFKWTQLLARRRQTVMDYKDYVVTNDAVEFFKTVSCSTVLF